MFDIPSFKDKWKDYDLSEIYKYELNFIYWVLDRYYECVAKDDTFEDQEWECVRKYIDRLYDDYFANILGGFNLKMNRGHSEDNRENSLKRFYESYKSQYSLSYEPVSRKSSQKTLVCRFDHPILVLNSDVWSKSAVAPQEIRRVRGNMTYLNCATDEMHCGSISGRISWEYAEYRIIPDLAYMRHNTKKLEQAIDFIFGSIENGWRHYKQDACGRGYEIYEHNDLLEFLFNLSGAKNHHLETEMNRTTLGGYLQDLCVRTHEGEYPTGKLAFMSALAKDFGVIVAMEEVLERLYE